MVLINLKCCLQAKLLGALRRRQELGSHLKCHQPVSRHLRYRPGRARRKKQEGGQCRGKTAPRTPRRSLTRPVLSRLPQPSQDFGAESHRAPREASWSGAALRSRLTAPFSSQPRRRRGGGARPRSPSPPPRPAAAVRGGAGRCSQHPGQQREPPRAPPSPARPGCHGDGDAAAMSDLSSEETEEAEADLGVRRGGRGAAGGSAARAEAALPPSAGPCRGEGAPSPLGATAAEGAGEERGGKRLTAAGASAKGWGSAGGEGKSQRYRSGGREYCVPAVPSPGELPRRFFRGHGSFGSGAVPFQLGPA